jgi:hypothetical protein
MATNSLSVVREFIAAGRMTAVNTGSFGMVDGIIR